MKRKNIWKAKRKKFTVDVSKRRAREKTEILVGLVMILTELAKK
jgi:hypothetical protein